jgi:pSer/pThr/pTyr-binding forkhead associated (FHA) protein
MVQLEVGGTRHPIPAGETVIGSEAGAGLRVTGDGVLPRHAIVTGGEAGASLRRAAPEAEILVNGVRLGGDPTPILHGDKIQLGQVELLAVDPARVGNTQVMSGIQVPGSTSGSRPAATPAGATGGRLVCLTDGREYQVGELLVFGRDAESDVVVTGSEVSRKHAEIRRADGGYVLTDASVNGTYVNGERVTERILARADVIRIGPDEFRFYADAPKPAAANGGPAAPEAGAARPAAVQPTGFMPAMPARPTPAPAPAAAFRTAEGPATPPTGAAHRLFDTMHGLPVTPQSQPAISDAALRTAAPLASLLVRSGALKGKRLPVRAPVVNIGRADYNDVVLPEPSVSTAHAKLQRRDGVWVLADLGSTNGTFVENEPVTDETPLTPGATIKFGEVAVLFEPADETMDAPAAGTRLMPRIDAEPGPSGEPAASGEEAAPAEPMRVRPGRPVVGSARRPGGPPAWAVLAALGAAAAAIAYTLLAR